jgi:serine/threonine-protein kinase
MELELSTADADADFGKYRLLVRIGHGGMAEVYVAMASGPAGFNKLFVVKRLLPALAADEEYRAMFLQEARLAARLNHPNVVATYEVGEHDGHIFTAMEYLEGQPLHRLRRALATRNRFLQPATCVRVACGVLAGLHYAHELRDFDGTPLKVVHRDVSPQNVFVTYTGQVKVLDFGIAKVDRGSSKTQAGILKGKYAYMAPEQFESADIDRRVDVFTAAVVLWELIANQPLFGGGTDAQVVRRVLHKPVPALSTIRPDVDPALDAILARALERDPGRRFQTAIELQTALEHWLATHPATNEDIGSVVSETFADVRKTVEDLLARHIGQRATLASTEALDDLVSVSSIKTAHSLASGTHGIGARTSGRTTAALATSYSERPSSSPRAARSSIARVIVTGTVVGFAGIGAVVGLRAYRGGNTQAAAATAATAPSATEAPPSAAPPIDPTPPPAASPPATATVEPRPPQTAEAAHTAAPPRVTPQPAWRPPAPTAGPAPPKPSVAPAPSPSAPQAATATETPTATPAATKPPEGRRFRTSF